MKSLQKLKKKKEEKFWRKCTNVKLNKKLSGKFNNDEFYEGWVEYNLIYYYLSLELSLHEGC